MQQLQNISLAIHSIFRWLILIFALLVIVRGLSGINGKKVFSNSDKRTALFLMISCDIQLLLGLILYFFGPWGLKNIQNMGMANVMHDNVARFFAIEHSIGMLVAIILVHVGYSATKKSIPDGSKFKRLFWCTFIALVIIIATIPWPGREAARALLPGMSA